MRLRLLPALALAALPGVAWGQTSFTVKTQPQLLYQFQSCAAQGTASGCIGPGNVRDVIGSVAGARGVFTPGHCPQFGDATGALVDSGSANCGGGNVTKAATGIITNAYYVSPSGSDANAGTLVAPFLTLGKCQTAMQGGTNKTCYLRAGTYSLGTGGLSFGASDANETWSYYPPDGVNSAILNGSSLTGIGWTIGTAASQMTMNGLSWWNPTAQITAYSQSNNTIWINNLFDGGGASTFIQLDFYGNNLLIANNTFQNSGSGSGAFGLYGNATGVTHSVIKYNTMQCLNGFGMELTAPAAGAGSNVHASNIIAYNTVYGIGHIGGAPPGCGTNQNDSGTGLEDVGGTGELYVGNTVFGVEGYAIISVGLSAGGGNIVSDNTVQSNSDPIIDLIGGNYSFAGCVNPNPCTNPNGVIRRNTITSPGSIGVNLGDENDVCNGGTSKRQGTANSALIAGNTFNTAYEPLWVTNSQNSIILGNTGNIGTVSAGGTAPHYQSGISLLNWAADGGGSCASPQNSTGNTIQLNSFTSVSANANYGLYYETNQTGNTASYNIFYPYGTPGTAAIQNNSGGTDTATNNQTTSSSAPLATAPPVANAGASGLIGAHGQSVTLDGSATRLVTGATPAGLTYAWTQILGSAVTIANASSQVASFTAPSSASQATVLGFKLTVSSANGSTYDQVYFGVDPSL
jgi:hypothetical protein